MIMRPRALEGENHGLLVQHVTTLAELLGGAGWQVGTTDRCDPSLPQRILAADLVVVQMLAAPEVEGVIRARRALGRPTVFEITDNFLGVGDSRGSEHPLASPLLRQRLLFHASLCDALQVYSPGLAELFDGVAPATVLFDPYVPIAEPPRQRGAGFVVGWGGTRSHADDLGAIAAPIRALCAAHDHITFSYMGDVGLYEQHFGALAPLQRRYRPFGDHDVYLDFVADLHVGVAPMGDAAFNAARTDTRFGTYAAQGAAAVLQDAPAHRPHAERARIFATADELGAILEMLHDDPGQVADLAGRAHAWALRERSADALTAQRDDAYARLITSETRVPTAGDPELADRFEQAEQADPETALAECADLVAAEPEFEQAHLLAAKSLEKLGRHDDAVAYAEGASVSAVYADLLHEVAARAAEPTDAARAHRHRSAIASPFVRARLEPAATAVERSHEVLVHQPYDHFALQVAIRRLEREAPDASELATLRHRACLVAPDTVADEHRPPRLRPFLPR